MQQKPCDNGSAHANALVQKLGLLAPGSGATDFIARQVQYIRARLMFAYPHLHDLVLGFWLLRDWMGCPPCGGSFGGGGHFSTPAFAKAVAQVYTAIWLIGVALTVDQGILPINRRVYCDVLMFS